MKVFNGELIIGTDGVYSYTPRGNYPDRWAVRPRDFEDPGIKEELRKKIQDWFDSQTAEELKLKVQGTVEDFRDNLKAGNEQILEDMVMAFIKKTLSMNLSHKFPPNVVEMILNNSLVTDNRQAFIASCSYLPDQLGISIDYMERLWSQAEQDIRTPDHAAAGVYRQLINRHVHNEITHAFGDPSNHATLDNVARRLCVDSSDETAYNILKSVIEQRMQELRQDPVALIEKGIGRYKEYAQRVMPGQTLEEWTEKLDKEFTEALEEKGNKKTTATFRRIIKNLPVACFTSPAPQLYGASSPATHARAACAAVNAEEKILAYATVKVPIIGVGTDSRYEFHNNFMEECSHAIDSHAALEPQARKILHELPIKFSVNIRSGLNQHGEFQGGNLELSGSVLELAKQFITKTMKKTGYTNKAHIPKEIRAEIMGLLFNGSIPEQDKTELFDKIGIKQQIETVMQNLSQPKTTRLTFLPDSIEQKTMDRISEIEFIGPNHYRYLGKERTRA